MLAGSQAWDWGFLTRHALFIGQSNRVCKMRITQHEENRGEEGGGGSKRWGGRVEEKEIKRRREEGEIVDTVRPPFPLLLRVNPGIVFSGSFVRTVGRRKWRRSRGPRMLGQIGTQFAFVKCASCESVCIPSTNRVVSRKISGFCYDSCPAFVLHNEKQWEVSQGWNWFA